MFSTALAARMVIVYLGK